MENYTIKIFIFNNFFDKKTVFFEETAKNRSRGTFDHFFR